MHTRIHQLRRNHMGTSNNISKIPHLAVIHKPNNFKDRTSITGQPKVISLQLLRRHSQTLFRHPRAISSSRPMSHTLLRLTHPILTPPTSNTILQVVRVPSSSNIPQTAPLPFNNGSIRLHHRKHKHAITAAASIILLKTAQNQDDLFLRRAFLTC